MPDVRLLWTYALARFFAVPAEDRQAGDGILIWVIIVAALAVAAIVIVAIITSDATGQANKIKTQ